MRYDRFFAGRTGKTGNHRGNPEISGRTFGDGRDVRADTETKISVLRKRDMGGGSSRVTLRKESAAHGTEGDRKKCACGESRGGIRKTVI